MPPRKDRVSPHFIGALVRSLKRADEVELSAGQIFYVREFFLELLDAILTEETLAGGIGLENHFDRMNFGDGHQGYFALAAIGAAAGMCDLFVKVSEIFCDGHCYWHLIVWMLH